MEMPITRDQVGYHLIQVHLYVWLAVNNLFQYIIFFSCPKWQTAAYWRNSFNSKWML